MATDAFFRLLTGTTEAKHRWSDDERFPGDRLNPNQITSGQGNNIFHVAAKQQESWSQQLDSILQEFPLLLYDTNARGDTPLHIAARLGNLDFTTNVLRHVKYFGLEPEANYENLLQKKNRKGNTALHEAAQNGHYHVAELLISEDPTVACSENKAGESPLFLALDGEYHKIALTILETGLPDCSISGRTGMTAMHAAVIRARPQLVAEDNKPLHSHTEGFIKHGYYFVGKVLEKWGSDILVIPDDINGWMPHHYAASMGKSRIVKRFLKETNSLAYIKDNEGMSALHISARNGHTNVIETLIQECPDVCELLDKKDRTALHVAVEHEQISVVRTLLYTKAFDDILNEQDEDGNTALHLACIQGNYEIIKELLNDSRTYKRTINNLGMTAYDIISRSKKLDLVRKLMIRLIYTRGQGNLLSLKGATEAMNRRKEEHEISTPTKDAEMSQLKNEASVEKESKDIEVKITRQNDAAMSSPLKEVSKELEEAKKARQAVADVNIIVATIVASITFTAALAMPGGYDGSSGLAILRKNTNFRRFLIFDSLAFGLSAASLLINFVMRLTSKSSGKLRRYPILLTLSLTFLSIIFSLFAFNMGTKAVLYEHNPKFGYGLPGNIAFIAFILTISYIFTFFVLY